MTKPAGLDGEGRLQALDLIKMARCAHENRCGGNDYILCNDCGLMWDYRKESANDGLVDFIKANPPVAAQVAPPPQEQEKPEPPDRSELFEGQP